MVSILVSEKDIILGNDGVIEVHYLRMAVQTESLGGCILVDRTVIKGRRFQTSCDKVVQTIP